MVQKIILKSRPVGMPTTADFEFTETTLAQVQEGQVKLKAVIVSVDPYMRGRMSEAKSYVAPYTLGEAISGGIVAQVIESKSDKFSVGEHVLGMLPWQEEMVVPADGLQRVDASIAPLDYYVGVLGMPGLTAYFGFVDICKPKAGETLVVSGAAGAVGIVVGQIAKLLGCRVVGIAGEESKVNYLLNDLKFDAVINYKTTKNLSDELSAACPNGVDIYFDNVGGDISDAVTALINFGARISLCGQISLYNSTSAPLGPRLQPTLLKRSAMMQGFIVSNFANRFPEGFKALASWVASGQIQYTSTKYTGFSSLPEAFIALFEGKNTGKLVVEIKA